MTITIPVIIWFILFLLSVHFFCIYRVAQIFSRILGYDISYVIPEALNFLYKMTSLAKLVAIGFVAYDDLWLGLGLFVFGFIFTSIMPIPSYYRRMIGSRLAVHEKMLLGIYENDDDFLHKL